MKHVPAKNHNILITSLFKWGGIPLSLSLAHLVLYSLNPQSVWWDFYRKGHWYEIGLSLLTGILMYTLILALISYLSRKIDGNAAYKDSLLIRLLATTALVVIGMFVLIYAEDLFFRLFCTENMKITKEMEQAFRNYMIVNVIAAAFINSFYNSYMFFERWKSAMIESNKLNSLSHELKETALQAELKMLKLQLDPHFLFNNFSILTQLIQTNKEDALLFLGNLSRVYRYVLASSKKDMISLEEELKFVENYFHLIKIRHGETLNLEVSINEEDKQKGIPPVTLQLLIENTIKHNIATVKSPLYISIESKGNGYIIVKNNLQRINIHYPDTGLGLTNIAERYQLLGGIKPEILESDTEFVVKLPLLNF